MSAAILEFPVRPIAPVRRNRSADVLILPVVRIERNDPDFSIPVVSASISPRSNARQTLAQRLINAEQRFPAAKEAGLEDGLAGTWQVIERAATLPQFDVLAYAAGYAEGQLSIMLVRS